MVYTGNSDFQLRGKITSKNCHARWFVGINEAMDGLFIEIKNIFQSGIF